MSASPQPPPPATAPPRDEPGPQTNGSPPASSSPAQLAALLTKALEDNEFFKSELTAVRRRADKAERLLATFQSTAQSPTNGSPGAQPKPSLPESARKAILDAENRAERAEQARDEADARLRMLQESWQELDRFFAAAEVRNQDVRTQFSRLVADGGGQLIPVSSIPFHLQQPLQPPSIPAPRSHPRGSHRLLAQPFPSVALPPPPSASSSRVRARADSIDAAYGSVLTGPGAPPPAKRPRSDRDAEDRARHRYSHSPSDSPHPTYLSNGHTADHSPQHAVHSSAAIPALHPHAHYHPYPRSRSDRDDPRYAYADQARVRRRGRSTSRGRSTGSRSHSRGSSNSLDEMLLAATATPGERANPDEHGHMRPIHPSQQHLHPSARHRSPSPGRSGDYHHLAVHPRARASSSAQLHPSAHVAPTQVASPPGPLPVPGQVATYQTHIFAPPVTGAPVKKSKVAAAGSLGTNGSILTLGPTGSVISGPSAVGGGGFPPTNKDGQRICRQCGLPGRYKEGKCVEKWGPGPEGPGTVCDRCRKKMKRVERRGTLDSQNLAAQMHHQPAAIHPSGAPQAAPGSLTNGRMSGSSQDRSVHRTDTIPAHTSPSHSRSLGPTGTHLLSSSQSGYVRDHREPASPYHPSSYPHSRSSQRGPTPPGIATLPNEDDGGYDDRAPRVRAPAHAHKPSGSSSTNGHRSGSGSGSSRSASHSPTLNATKGGSGLGASPRGSHGKSKSSSDLMDVDADGEEVDADADADGEGDGEEGDADGDADPDAEAELLEAVDAAEANNATDEEWLKKEDA